MKIITYKNNLITYEDFLKNANDTSYIDGLIIPIIMTKDKQIVVFDDQITGTQKTEVIQNNTFNELKNSSIIRLEEFLDKMINFNKRIIINLYPLYQVILSNETIQYINEQNNEYINLVNEIINKFPKLKLSLCTYNQPLLQFIKRIIKTRKKGLIILQEDLNYMDVDFYIIPPTMLDALIINQEIDQGKEIMISSFSSNDLAIINEYFIKYPTTLKNNTFNKLTFISAHPELFYQLFTNKRLN